MGTGAYSFVGCGGVALGRSNPLGWRAYVRPTGTVSTLASPRKPGLDDRSIAALLVAEVDECLGAAHSGNHAHFRAKKNAQRLG